jgi:hypothetical protein
MPKEIFFPSEKALEDCFFELLTDYCAHEHDHLHGIEEDEPTAAKYHGIIKEVFRQIPVGAYGIMDVLLTVLYENPKDGRMPSSWRVAHIFEMKNVPLQSGDMDQVLRYKKALADLHYYDQIICHLIGTDVKSGHYIIEQWNSDDFHCYTYSLTYSGIDFSVMTGFGMDNGQYSLDVHQSILVAKSCPI